MSADAPSSVLLLAWDSTSASAWPLARALAATAATELWTAQPLRAHLPAAAGLTVRSLAEAPPRPALPALGSASPAFPYVGSTPAAWSATKSPGAPLAVPAAPYRGSSPGPEQANSASGPTPEAAPAAAAAAPRFAVPAAPYAGATHAPAAASPALPSPMRPAQPFLERPSNFPGDPAAGGRPAAEPGPAETVALTLGTADPAAGLAPAPALAEPLPAPAPTAETPETPPAAPLAAAATTAEPAAEPAAAEPDDAELAWRASAQLNFQIIQYARHAARLAHESAFEVIFAADWHTWLAGVELRQLTRRPLVLHLSQLATDLASPAERGWVEALERITLPQADCVLVPDEATAERLRQRYRLPAGRVQVLPPGTEPDLTAALVLHSQFPA